MRLCHLGTDTWRKTCMLWYLHTNIPLFTTPPIAPTPSPPHTVFIIMDRVREQCEDFYHSYSLKQQPSAYVHVLLLCLWVWLWNDTLVLTHAYEWVQLISPRFGWMFIMLTRWMILIHQHSLIHIASWTLHKVHNDERCRYKTDDFNINSTSTTVYERFNGITRVNIFHILHIPTSSCS